MSILKLAFTLAFTFGIITGMVLMFFGGLRYIRAGSDKEKGKSGITMIIAGLCIIVLVMIAFVLADVFIFSHFTPFVVTTL